MTNPLAAIPARYRSAVYLALFVASAALGIWQATEGDWLATAIGVLSALGFGTAQTHTPKE